jgi:uncharacterized membrane protein YheB (UPF0754 family)
MMMTSHSNLIALASIPIVSALIGYVTNYIAVKMLFRPKMPCRVLGITLQGLVPRRQKEIAASLGKMIERDLLSHSDIQAALKGAETSQEAAAFLNEQIDLFVQRLGAQNPMIGAFLQGPLLEQVKGMLAAQMSEKFPVFMERVVERLESRLDIQEIVRSKVEAFDLTKLEAVIQEVTARELKMIEALGGVLGFIIGVLQVGVMVAFP